MKRFSAVLVLGVILFPVLVLSASPVIGADFPYLINYQGMLTDDENNPLTDTVEMIFKIYNHPTSTSAGYLQWQETHSEVSVENGLFSVILGSESLHGVDLDFSEEYWLDITVDGEPLSSRLQFASVGYAYRSLVADTADLAISAPSGGGWVDGESVVILETSTDNVGIGTTDPGAKLEVAGDIIVSDGTDNDSKLQFKDAGGISRLDLGTATSSIGVISGKHILTFITDTDDNNNVADFVWGTDGNSATYNELLRLTDEGKLGIGTDIPAQKLDVSGTAQMTGFKMPTGASSGKVLTSDASGVGTWQTMPGEIGGGGTSNYIPKFTASTTLDNSVMYETGGNLGIGQTIPEHRLHVTGSEGGDAYNGHAVGYFENTVTSQDAAAVFGKCNATDSYGYGGYFWGGLVGVQGTVAMLTQTRDCCGVLGYVQNPTAGSSYGVYGLAASTGSNYAVYGRAENGSTNWAGYFDGDVRVTGTLTEGAALIKIDHPLDPSNKFLNHSLVESPDMKTIYDGVAVLDQGGEASVELPEWFEDLNRNYRYQLTAVGAPGPNLYIAQEISNNQFKIAGGTPGMKVSWQVTGIRQDAYANAHTIPVEEAKSGEQRGKYLHPQERGMPEKAGIGYETRFKAEHR